MKILIHSGLTLLLILGVILLAGCNNDNGDSFENEGTESNPVVITVGTAHSGSIAGNGTSYYKFTTAGSGDYTIGLTNTQSDLSWDLFSDPDFITMVWWCDNYDHAADEIDTVSLSATTTYYLEVEEDDGTGGTFTLTVTGP